MERGHYGKSAVVSLAFLVLSSAIFCVCGSKRPPYCSQQDGKPFTFLWLIKRDPPSYFFGTIHVPYTRVWDYMPDVAKQAFERCDNVFFELDLLDPYTVSALSSCQMLPHGENLVDVLPSDLYRRLKRHLDYVKGIMPSWMTADQRGRGLYADYLFNAITGNWEKKRPVWVMLMVNSLTEGDVRSRGIPVLDLYLAQEAERMSKRTGAVEKVEEQCLPLNGLNLSQVLFALNHTLGQHEGIRAGDLQVAFTTDDLIRHYNCGNLNAMVFSQDTTQVPHLSSSPLSPENSVIAQNIDNYFRQELIFNRNMRMGKRVVQLLMTYPQQSFFFAFGAGHFLGNNTVLDFVQAGGFQIEHVSVNTRIPGVKKSSGQKDQKSGALPDWVDNNFEAADGMPAFRHPPLSRRPFRRRPNGQGATGHFFDTTLTPPVSTTRKFNELWVRLDATRSTRPLPQEAPNDDLTAIKRALHTWYGLTSSAPVLFNETVLLVLCFCYLRLLTSTV